MHCLLTNVQVQLSPGSRATMQSYFEGRVGLVDTAELVGVYILQQRLSCFPTWGLRLYRRVALHRRAAGWAVVYESLATAPRSASTVVRLIAMEYVSSNVRERKVRWPLKYAESMCVRYTSTNCDVIAAFNDALRLKCFCLVKNSCLTCTEALTAFLVDRNMGGTQALGRMSGAVVALLRIIFCKKRGVCVSFA